MHASCRVCFIAAVKKQQTCHTLLKTISWKNLSLSPHLLSVSELRGDDELPLLAHAHAQDALLPTLDHLFRRGKKERFNTGREASRTHEI